jgi:hypothetical protein
MNIPDNDIKKRSLEPAKIWKSIKYPYDRIISLIFNYVKNFKGNSLDIGCSGGVNLKVLDELGFYSYGIEPDKDSYLTCLHNNPNLKNNISNETLENFIEKDSKLYNLIICWGISPLGIIDNFKELISKLNSNIIICNYRSPNNSILKRKTNKYYKDNTILIQDKDHHNNNMLYRYHAIKDLEIPNYSLVHIQTHSHHINKSYIKRFKNNDKDEWYECVYFKTSLFSGFNPEILFSYPKDDFKFIPSDINNLKEYLTNKLKGDNNIILDKQYDDTLLPLTSNKHTISYYVIWGKVLHIVFEGLPYDSNGNILDKENIKSLPNEYKLLSNKAVKIAIYNKLNIVKLDLFQTLHNKKIEYKISNYSLPNYNLDLLYENILLGYEFRDKFVR